MADINVFLGFNSKSNIIVNYWISIKLSELSSPSEQKITFFFTRLFTILTFWPGESDVVSVNTDKLR